MSLARRFAGRGVFAAAAAMVAVAALVAPAGGGPQATGPAATQPAAATSRPNLDRFADDVNRFVEWDRRNSFPKDAVLFVGSSSIRLWPTRESFPQWPVINRGFGGSHIVEVNHYFAQVVAPYTARVIVFYAGDNDVAAGTTPEQVRDNFAEFVRRVRERQPDTPIVFLSIKPSESRWKHWPRMREANALVRDLCRQERHVVFVDVGTPLLGPDGRPRAELYRDDKLHLSAAGYEVWTRELTPVLYGADASAAGTNGKR